MAALTIGPLAAEPFRIATFNTELSRKGPGLLLRDILRGGDEQIDAAVALLVQARPDIVALQGIDHDLRGTALAAFQTALRDAGLTLDHAIGLRPNSGQRSGLDLNGNGRTGDADDAHGYGRFAGAGGMALLSRFPLEIVTDYTAMLWRDLPQNIYPTGQDGPFGGPQVLAAHRLSSKGHWVVSATLPDGSAVEIMTYHATPPVFDGPEDRNGRRNHDETALWSWHLDTRTSTAPFVILGVPNIDTQRGEGRPEAIEKLLADPRVQSPFGNDPTADFRDPVPGDLRVDYLLPSAEWDVRAFGTLRDAAASRHSLLWADLDRRDP
ncbi:endonuclease/exonuclease/phosphatase family protein [Sulfitobacter sp. S190]|uniref:endonuclease/exonuclease/phosphatase family protein n=1 Tax=Sulfitobacter sp. S190 TaxID=2867022 RepID=UPI0021A5C765|nr:endonuclease/exonuclease/phosphatase family protein [Sulfitobacter sp. S190]UWR24277.1 endonuclease/exonuclease/phosphatase family protein [Sulfitobacter sp. S190]